jgi:1-acyl-sn-glycerol-3-phosphate acyltransferase
MDSAMCAVAMPFRKLIFVSLPRNFNLGVAGFFVDVLGSVPAPSSPGEMGAFIYSLSKHLRRGRTALFFPEGELRPYSEELGPFQRGAFYLAADAQVPVFPIRIVFRPPSGLLGLLRKKPCFTMICGDPVYPNHLLLKVAAIEDLQRRTEEAMHSLPHDTPP